MKTEEITIKTLPVEIHVIRVGGHKMTKAVFDQIKEALPEHLDLIICNDPSSADLVNQLDHWLNGFDSQSSNPDAESIPPAPLFGYVRTTDGVFAIGEESGELLKFGREAIEEPILEQASEGHRTRAKARNISVYILKRIQQLRPHLFIAT